MTAEVKDELSRLVVTFGERAARRGGLAAALRRRAAHRGRPRGRRGRSGLGQHRATVAQGHLRPIRLQRRRACVVGQRHPQEHALCGAGRQRRRGAGPTDRAARSARPAGARLAGPGRRRQRRRCRSRVARSILGPRIVDRAGSFVGAGSQLPRTRGGFRAGGRGAPAGDQRQGARGARRRPGGGARR